ncbi:hypothetical protein HK405_009868, partial [Cladochytrium tenue]
MDDTDTAAAAVATASASAEQTPQLPQKKFFRQRAHANPFSDHLFTHPIRPADYDWSQHFPAHFPAPGAPAAAGGVAPKAVEFADV